MLKSSRLFIAAVISVSIIAISSPALSQKIEYEDGVRIVNNEKPLWGNNTKVALEFVQRIGVLDGLDDNYLFGGVKLDVKKDKEENIYILDFLNYRVQKFNPFGKYLNTYGTGFKGQGPAEFESPFYFGISSSGFIYIGDTDKQKILVLNQERKEIRRFQVEKQQLADFLLTSDDKIVMNAWITMTRDEQSRFLKKFPDRNANSLRELEKASFNPLLLRVYDNNGIMLLEFGSKKIYDEPDLSYGGNNFNFALDNKDNIYVAFLTQNRIEKYSIDGRLLLKFDRPLNYKVTTKKVIVKEPGIMPRIKMNFVSTDIGIDHEERIWTVTVTKQREKWNSPDDRKFEIFNKEGILLGSLPIPENIHVSSHMRIYQDKLYLIDNVHELSVFEFKIVDK